MRPAYNVLFLCTHNSAGSIMAEAILNHLPGMPNAFRAYSAGSRAGKRISPYALEHLARIGLPTHGLYSKSWDEFAGPGAPTLHFVFTVCDHAAREAVPVWPGHPVIAHWGIPDPSAFEGSEAEIRVAYSNAFDTLRQRIRIFAGLPLDKLSGMALEKRLIYIGKPGARHRRPEKAT
jgi:arsenate reductase